MQENADQNNSEYGHVLGSEFQNLHLTFFLYIQFTLVVLKRIMQVWNIETSIFHVSFKDIRTMSMTINFEHISHLFLVFLSSVCSQVYPVSLTANI